MFPTLASLLEERMRDHLDLTHAAIHALNEWMYETWTFNYENRIFATPVITLPIVEKAIEELEWCVERGAKTVLIRPAPVPGLRGLALVRLPRVRPLLAGRRGRRHPRVDAFLGQWLHAVPERLDRPERDVAVPARLLPLHDRRPPSGPGHDGRLRLPRRVRRASPSCGSRPSRPAGNGSRTSSSTSPTSTRRCRTPSTTTRSSSSSGTSRSARSTRTTWASIIDVIGADHVLFGSDYPHPEGLAEPCSYVDHLPAGAGRGGHGERSWAATWPGS